MDFSYLMYKKWTDRKGKLSHWVKDILDLKMWRRCVGVLDTFYSKNLLSFLDKMEESPLIEQVYLFIHEA